MKKLIALLLIAAVLGMMYGCSQQKTAAQNLPASPSATPAAGNEATAPSNAPTAANPELDNSDILGDVDSISNEIQAVNADDTGDAITPISAADISD